MSIIFNDDFAPPLYSLQDGQLSPNQKLRCMYAGFGSVKTAKIPPSTRTGNCLHLKPQVNQTGTSACLVLTEKVFTDFNVTFFMNTYEHTRSNPENWETAWFMFRYTDDTHHYYVFIQKNGTIEIGKKDYEKIGTNQVKTPDGKIHNVDTQDRQQFLFTEAKVDFALKKWFKLQLIVKGASIKLWVNDTLKADITDNGQTGTDGITGQPLRWKPSSVMFKGKLGFYCEDSYALYDNILIRSV